MKTESAVEWLAEKLRLEFGFAFSNNILEQAKEMEKQQKSIYQLFIGKVVGVLGTDKTIELLKECKEALKK